MFLFEIREEVDHQVLKILTLYNFIITIVWKTKIF
jgi:hypothetical protein